MSRKEAFRVAFGRPAVRMMMLLMAVVMGVGVSMIILQQPFLDSHGVRYGLFGPFLMPGQFLSMAGALLAYRVSTALGVSKIIALMPLVVLTTAIGLGVFDHLAAFAFYPLTTLVFATGFVVISDYLNRRIPSANRATILSIQNMIFSLIVAAMEVLLLPGHRRLAGATDSLLDRRDRAGGDRDTTASTLAAGAPAGVVGRRSTGRRPRGRAGTGAASLGFAGFHGGNPKGIHASQDIR